MLLLVFLTIWVSQWKIHLTVYSHEQRIQHKGLQVASFYVLYAVSE